MISIISQIPLYAYRVATYDLSVKIYEKQEIRFCQNNLAVSALQHMTERSIYWIGKQKRRESIHVQFTSFNLFFLMYMELSDIERHFEICTYVCSKWVSKSCKWQMGDGLIIGNFFFLLFFCYSILTLSVSGYCPSFFGLIIGGLLVKKKANAKFSCYYVLRTFMLCRILFTWRICPYYIMFLTYTDEGTGVCPFNTHQLNHVFPSDLKLHLVL